MGAPDLVRAAAARFEAAGFSGSLYPNRESTDLRFYADLDDRLLAKLLGVGDPPVVEVSPETPPASKRPKLAGRKRLTKP